MSIDLQRLIGSYSQSHPGPLLFFIGGIHGNEPAGVYALERVFSTLEKLHPNFRGELVGVRGNIPALAAGKRFLDHDLNRLWSQDQINRITHTSYDLLNIEERQFLKLFDLIESYMERSEGEFVLIDLHTTSAFGGLFSIVTEHDEFNHQLASALHAPVIFGLSDALSTTTNRFMEERGVKGLAFESGQHDDPLSVDLHESAIWLSLEKCGCIDSKEVPDFAKHHERLIVASRKLPHYVSVTHKHRITPEDKFNMHPGYTNFHEIYRGEPLAQDRNGQVICPQSGMILMPLYQQQGEEGFYIIEKIEEPPNHQ